MDVYFGEYFRKKHHSGEKLIGIHIDKDFIWEDIEGKIAAMYIGDEGVVLDVCTRTSMDKVYAFAERWPEARDDSHLTQEQLERIENDHPMRMDFQVELKINGIKLSSEHGCGMGWYPESFEERAIAPEAEELMEEYQCDKNYAWFFSRRSFRWDERIEPLEIIVTFKSDKVSVSGEHFVTKSGCEEQEVSFTNPLNKEEYKLKVHSCAPMILDRIPDLKMCDGLEFPTHYHELLYSAQSDSGIDNLDFRLVDCKEGDHARRSHVTNSTTKAAAVAIIGGAHGPTSFFIASKLKGSDEQKYSAFSSMYFEKQEEVEWRSVFQMERRKDMELMIKL